MMQSLCRLTLCFKVDWEHVMTELKAIRGVQEVHDLHIWSISSKSTSLTVHIRVSGLLLLTM
jgi:Co/Zn/Cd efflux system component